MTDKKQSPWKITFIDEHFYYASKNKLSTEKGYYKLTFNGCLYGIFSKESLKEMDNLPELIEIMLNHAHEFATKEWLEP